MSVLEVQNLEKSFSPGLFARKQPVLKSVSFKIEPESVTAFLGANGAGKTTTMKCLLGLIFPDAGKIKYFGSSEFDNETRMKIGFLPERPYFYSYLTGVEFLQFYGQLSLKMTKVQMNERINELLKKVDLYHAKDRPLRDYSKGMLQKIGIAQALIHRPELIILDEPMSGLDPDGRYYINEIIKETAESGTAVFLSSHLLNDAERICKRVIILKDGEVHFEGQIDKLLNQFNVGYEVEFIENGNVKVADVKDIESLQSEVDKLRAQGAQIVNVVQNGRSLEDYFVKDVLKARA